MAPMNPPFAPLSKIYISSVANNFRAFNAHSIRAFKLMYFYPFGCCTQCQIPLTQYYPMLVEGSQFLIEDSFFKWIQSFIPAASYHWRMSITYAFTTKYPGFNDRLFYTINFTSSEHLLRITIYAYIAQGISQREGNIRSEMTSGDPLKYALSNKN